MERYWEKLLNSQFISTLQENKKVIKSSQHGFLKSKSCQNNLISSFDVVTFSVMDKKEAEDEIALLLIKLSAQCPMRPHWEARKIQPYRPSLNKRFKQY